MSDPIRNDREVMDYDVVIVGGGPSGLACAIKLKQMALEQDKELAVCLVEKAAEIGGHLLSGAVFETRALDELIPDWKERDFPLKVAVQKDEFAYLTDTSKITLPTPPQMHNHGNYIISLGNLARRLAQIAEEAGVEIYPGFAAAEVLYNDKNQVIGIATGDRGLDREGQRTEAFEPGVELHAKQTIFAEGCRGSLTKTLFDKYDLRKESDPQTYGIGIKEIWQIDPKHHREGSVLHTIGWPMDSQTYGGSWLYHMEDNQISVGFVVGLDYQNPYLSPFQEFQRFKLHPAIKHIFEGGKRIAYGSRAISEGGLQSLPKLTFPGGVLIGDTAGFLNTPKIKGNHTAMKSGMIAAEAVFNHLSRNLDNQEVQDYQTRFKDSWLYDELYRARNIRPSFHKGLWHGIIYSALDTYLFRGKAPWTFHNKADHKSLKLKDEVKPIDYPKPDGKVTFDRLSSVFLSNTNHQEDQPCHLTLKDASVAIDFNLKYFDAPEQRYCPAGVYEIIYDKDGQNPKLQINSQNCVHCKTCDIKDPKQNIDWVTPYGGDGPNYPNM